MSYKTIIYEVKDEIATIRLNRPEVLNAQNRQLIDEFLQALKVVQAAREVKVIVIKGEGRAFCSGDDLTENRDKIEETFEIVEALQDTSRIIMTMGKPVIAAVHGYALGGGCEWAMNCDIRIAAEGTKFGFPETSLGATVTNAGTKILPLLVGLGRAKELVFSNEIIDARQAEQWGLVNKVVPLEELDSAALELAKKITKNSTLAIHLSKKALNRSIYEDFEQTLEQEARDITLMFCIAESSERAKVAFDKIKKKR